MEKAGQWEILSQPIWRSKVDKIWEIVPMVCVQLVLGSPHPLLAIFRGNWKRRIYHLGHQLFEALPFDISCTCKKSRRCSEQILNVRCKCRRSFAARLRRQQQQQLSGWMKWSELWVGNVTGQSCRAFSPIHYQIPPHALVFPPTILAKFG